MLDPQLGVWHNIDPHVENYESITPYGYPIRFFEISGRDPGDIVIFFGGANITMTVPS